MSCWLSTASATFKFIADKDGMMTDHKAFQLANVRVPSPRRHRKRPGSARRAEVTSKEETRRPRLIPGIYALCEIQSAAYPGAGANDESSPLQMC
jgi:hypothetical protein